MRFRDRRDAGRQLAARLSGDWRVVNLDQPEQAIVLGLPRGGVPVAAEVAATLGLRFDVFVACKIGYPGHEELGVGAIVEGTDETVVSGTAAALGIEVPDLERLALRQRRELERRVARYRAGRALPNLAGWTVILVDDGLATGVTAEAALRALRKQRPRRLVLAVPVCAPGTHRRLGGLADEVICLRAPSRFGSVGSWYQNFDQTSDAEVVQLLARQPRAA